MSHAAWLRAVSSEQLSTSPLKKQVTARIEAPLAVSLESMAQVLHKTPTKLLTEIIEAGIYTLSDELKKHRPDLLRPQTREELEDQAAAAAYENIEFDDSPVPTWKTPQFCMEIAGRPANVEDMHGGYSQLPGEVVSEEEAQ